MLSKIKVILQKLFSERDVKKRDALSISQIKEEIGKIRSRVSLNELDFTRAFRNDLQGRVMSRYEIDSWRYSIYDDRGDVRNQKCSCRRIFSNTSCVVSWEVPDQTGVLFLSLVENILKKVNDLHARSMCSTFMETIWRRMKRQFPLYEWVLLGIDDIRYREKIQRTWWLSSLKWWFKMSVEFLKSNIGQKRR